MRYKFHKFVDSLEVALDAWYFSRYDEDRGRRKLSTEEMQAFIRDVDGWSHMFFCSEDQIAMNDINYNTLEVLQNGKNKNAN